MENNIKWDYKIGDPVFFFDPTKSYQLTKYRPINMNQGLDFDPYPFQEVYRVKRDTGKYCKYPIGSPKFKDFWKEEYRKCKEGLEINGYRITGDHYFFLNFYRLLSVDSSDGVANGRDYVAPTFWSKHYEYLHYLELCKKLDKDSCVLKSRGVGFSELAASLGANLYTCTQNSKSYYTASSENYLLKNGVLQKVWDILEYLNQNTEGGMRHVRMKKNEPMWKRASVLSAKGEESGWMSEIFGQIVDDPKKLRGARVEFLFMEEAGSYPKLVTVWNQAEALVKLLGKRIGIRCCWGTGGDSGPGLEGLEQIFLNPQSFDVLPYYNNYNKAEEYTLTGFFVPAFSVVPNFMDSRGVTDEVKAKEYYNKEREKKSYTPQNYLEYCSEFCFYPQEALSRKGENQFDQTLIADQLTKVQTGIISKPKIGKLRYIYDENNNPSSVVFEEDKNGQIIVVEEPMLNESNHPINNLYVAGIDSIDHAEDDSVVGSEGSKFCITVKKRTFGNTGNKYVCMYIERPHSVKTAYENALKILMWYGCKANLEDTKIGFRQLRTTQKLQYKFLMQRPMSASSNNKRNNNLWGTPGSEKMIKHGLELISQFVDDFHYNIEIEQMLLQLQNFSYSNKGKYDIILAMCYTEIADEDMAGIVIKKDDITSEWEEGGGDIGYYINSKGQRAFGVIYG